MSNKVRYKLTTSYKLKTAHKVMVKNFDVIQVSTGRSKDGTEFIYFSVKRKEEAERMENFFSGLGIKYEKIKA